MSTPEKFPDTHHVRKASGDFPIPNRCELQKCHTLLNPLAPMTKSCYSRYVDAVMLSHAFNGENTISTWICLLFPTLTDITQ